MLKTLSAYIGEYKKVSIKTPIYIIIEVLMEILIPFVTASIIDKGIQAGDMSKVLMYGGLMLVLAVIFIYLIMVAQFQSLLSPFIIMFCIPLAFTGGFIALFITGNELGIISMLGFIMLAGLIVNNGIVLIDYINQARREGMSKHEAIIDAGRTRLRPILMTAMTTILAMFTSAIGIGDGSDMIKPMAIAIIGGLVYGTILTLIVIPCIYDAFNREKSMVEEEL